MKGPLTGKVAVVTGVSRAKGIGAAISRELARQGANLFLTGWPEFDDEESWRPDELEQPLVISELRALGVEAEWIALDLSLHEASQKVWDVVQAGYLLAHILI